MKSYQKRDSETNSQLFRYIFLDHQSNFELQNRFNSLCVLLQMIKINIGFLLLEINVCHSIFFVLILLKNN